jgi:hypothetical protein
MAKITNRKTKRDSLVYEAEWEALGFGGFFIDLADAQEWTNSILASRWWKTRSKIRRVDLSYGQIKRWCWTYLHPEMHTTEAKIDLVRGRLCENYLYHELAHLLAWPVEGEEQHGDRFIAALLDVLRHHVPTLYYKKFMKALEDRGISCPTK